MEALHQEIENREMFIGAFSHELKTPLTSNNWVLGYVAYQRIIQKMGRRSVQTIFIQKVED